MDPSKWRKAPAAPMLAKPAPPKVLSQAEKDLLILRQAEMIKRDPDRFKAARALPGGSNI